MVDEIKLPAIGQRSTFLERALAIAAVITAVAVPLATSYIAAKYAEQSSKRQGDVKLVELAVGILQEEPKPAAQAVRIWALDVLDAYSGVKISAQARSALSTTQALPGGSLRTPALLGLDAQEAMDLVGKLGLNASVAGAKSGRVVSQSPAAGTLVERGALLSLQVQ